MPHWLFRTRLLVIAALLAAAGCAIGGPTGDIDKLAIEQGQFDVAVTNTAGKALFDVRVAIERSGPAPAFTTIVPRMENGEKRVIAHSLLRDRDSVPFSPRNVKASKITVTAKDMDGKEYTLQVYWK